MEQSCDPLAPVEKPMTSGSRALDKTRRLVVLTGWLPVIAWAIVRVHWLERRLDLAALADRLRDVPRFPWVGPTLAGDLLIALDWLLPKVPPRGLGYCYRRSLVLLDLWSRCGLAPRFHFGVRPLAGGVEAHAWVVTVAGPSTPAFDYPEALVF